MQQEENNARRTSRPQMQLQQNKKAEISQRVKQKRQKREEKLENQS